MHPKRLLPTCLLLLLAASPGRAVSSAPTPGLVADLEPAVLNLGSLPFSYVTLGNGRSVFLADGLETGRELWGSDGTAAGTTPLLDACAGPCSYQYTLLGRVGLPADRAVFFTSDPASGVSFGSLWVTGGSRGGTFLLADGLQIDPETRPVQVPGLDLLFFVASDGVHGFELWRTDGTAAGTRRVRDLRPGAGSPGIRELTAFKERLFFVAHHQERGPALWTSDGTPAGTRLVRDPWVGRSDHPAPAFLRVVGLSLFFFAPSPAQGFELWRSDGTRAGTLPAVDLVPGPGGVEVAGATVAGGRFYFIGAIPGQGQELWTSNGALRGTRRLTDLPADDAFWREDLQLPVAAPEGRAAFVANDGEHGLEPWLTDGTPAGTRLLDLCPGACGSNPVLDRVHAGRLHFSADDGRRGREPWASTGTVAGTRLLRDLCAGSCSSNPDFLGTLGRHLLFTADRVGLPGTRLFRTDGTWNGTVRIAVFAEPLLTHFFETAGEVPGALLFTGWDPEHGHELWRTDATAAGTRLLADLVGRVPSSSVPSHLTAVGDRLLFTARDRESGEVRIRFWESDGTAAGTVPRGGGLPLSCFNELYLLTVLPDVLPGGDPLFACPENGSTQALWRGTESGPVRLTAPGVLVFPFAPVAVLGSTVFFTASEPGLGYEPWKTDGTPEGTVRIADLQPGSGSIPPHGYTVFQGRVWFTSDSGLTNGSALWSTDGTEDGTRLLLPPNTVQHLLILGVHGGRLWFTARADSGLFGYELWSTDGTAEGTRGFDLVPGRANSAPFRLISAGSRMFFSGSEGGQGLWVSDGTEEGSRRIGPASLRPSTGLEDAALAGGLLFYRSFEDEALWVSDGIDDPEGAGTRLLPGPDGQPIVGAYDLTPFGSQLFFLWQEAIWRTDGTAAGTVRVEGDFRTPGELTVAGPRLFFRATDDAHGTELWVLE